MKLLTREAGWASTGFNLFYTTDGGQHWKDIAPRLGPGQDIDSVFFLDPSTGWALLISEIAGSDELRFDLASTTDAGTSWSITALKFPHNMTDGTLTGGANLDFVDPLHGWMDLPIVSSSAFRPGVLIATANGGKSWDWAPGSPGVYGDIRFISLKDGWLAGGPGNQTLFVTHDGSKSWQEEGVGAPSEVGKAVHATYGQAPLFENRKQGFLSVTFSGPEGTQSQLVLFASDDGGKSWKPDRIMAIGETSQGSWRNCTVADSLWIIPGNSKPTHSEVRAIARAGKPATRDAHILALDSGVMDLSFVNAATGWVLVSDAHFLNFKVLSTVNGGATWTDVTPPSAAGQIPWDGAKARPKK